MLVKNINNASKQCKEVFTGTDVAWAVSQGFTEQEAEQGYDGNWYLAGFAPKQPISEQNDLIRQKREHEYIRQIDPLHAEKQRKEILQEWTAELEAQYHQRVQELSAKIKAENPYVI